MCSSVHSHCWVTIITVHSLDFFIIPNWIFHPLNSNCLFSLAPAPRNNHSNFCPCDLAYSVYPDKVEWYTLSMFLCLAHLTQHNVFKLNQDCWSNRISKWISQPVKSFLLISSPLTFPFQRSYLTSAPFLNSQSPMTLDRRPQEVGEFPANPRVRQDWDNHLVGMWQNFELDELQTLVLL